jgi:hypothetical protein
MLPPPSPEVRFHRLLLVVWHVQATPNLDVAQLFLRHQTTTQRREGNELLLPVALRTPHPPKHLM